MKNKSVEAVENAVVILTVVRMRARFGNALSGEIARSRQGQRGHRGTLRSLPER